MKNNLLFAFLLFAMSSLHSAPAQNPFFAMSSGFRAVPPAEQVAWLAAHGYDGIAAHVWNDELLARLKIIADSEPVVSGKLKLCGVYFPYNLTAPDHRALASKILQLAQPTRTPLWITVQKPSATDERVVALLQSLCDEAAPLGLDVIYYPHDNHHCLDVEHSLRLLAATKRPNLFTSLHLHQELRAGHAARLEEIVIKALPHTHLVSISGANTPDKINRHSNDWSDVVQPFAQSTFDLHAFYQLLVKHGYTGPVGYQNWGIPGDPRVHHLETLRIWRSWQLP